MSFKFQKNINPIFERNNFITYKNGFNNKNPMSKLNSQISTR